MASKKQGGSTVANVWRLAEPIAAGLGLELWDVRFLKEGAQWYLRIFIDRPQGVTIEDCEAMSRAIDGPLDELDLIEQSYCLEVCSPGLERELIQPAHFARFAGAPVIVRLIRPLPGGEKELRAVLEGLEDGVIILQRGEETLRLPKKDTVFVKLDDFDDEDFGGLEQ
jgi:ribosome maturation factor RimP